MEEMITGIGGIFLKTGNTEKTYQWYKDALGLNTDAYGKSFMWREHSNPDETGMTQFSLFKKESEYFGKPEQQAMVNFRVKNLELLLEELAKKGITPVKPMETFEYGKFCWIEDPEGNRIELWEP